MSAEVVVKKRGRPKKVSEADSIVVIDTTPDPTETASGKVRRARVSKTNQPEVVVRPTVRSKATRKVKSVETEIESEVLDTTKRKKPAKNVQNGTPNQPDVNTSVTASILPIVLKQAIHEDEQAKALGSSPVASEAIQISSLKPRSQSENQVLNNPVVNTIETERLTIQIPAEHGRASSQIIEAEHRVPVDIKDGNNTTLPTTSSISQSSDSSLSIARLASTLHESENTLNEAAIKLNAYQKQFERRLLLETWSIKLEQFTQENHITSKIIQEITDRRAATEAELAKSQNLLQQVVTPTKTVDELQFTLKEVNVQTFHIQTQLDQLLKSRQPITPSSTTMSQPQPPSSFTTPSPQQATTISSQSNTKQSPQPTSKPTINPRLPQSSSSTITSIPTRQPGPPIDFPTPTSKPRPTEQTLAELKRNPDFKRLSRSWTGLIVGIPVMIATSVVLWRQYQEKQMERSLGLDSLDGEHRRHIGVDSKKVGSAVNGGV